MSYLVDFVLHRLLVVFVIEIDTVAWSWFGYKTAIHPIATEYVYRHWQSLATYLDIVSNNDTLRIKPVGMFTNLVKYCANVWVVLYELWQFANCYAIVAILKDRSVNARVLDNATIRSANHKHTLATYDAILYAFVVWVIWIAIIDTTPTRYRHQFAWFKVLLSRHLVVAIQYDLYLVYAQVSACCISADNAHPRRIVFILTIYFYARSSFIAKTSFFRSQRIDDTFDDISVHLTCDVALVLFLKR